MRQQCRLNLFEWTSDITGIETYVVPVQHVPTLWRMSKDAAQNRVRDALSSSHACK